MNIVYEYVNVSASETLEKLVNEKMEAIENRFPFVVRGDVFFKLDNKDEGEQHHCGIRLSVPGPRVYASSNKSTFVEAVNATIRDLKDLLEKKKG
ncbi:MAG TPA: HPF/RaiA family ribosome-associated protein, partial [Flavobacteriaceae bacterium]|nr:HPF/RaiA family ribosome-associated protein [Flavobacteriaceae bacterium]